jgi:ParB family chromosome partitioning protein
LDIQEAMLPARTIRSKSRRSSSLFFRFKTFPPFVVERIVERPMGKQASGGRGRRLSRGAEGGGMDVFARQSQVWEGIDSRVGRGHNVSRPRCVKEERKNMDSPNITELTVESVESSPFQTRSDFPDEGLRELAESIKREGLLQPILVRPKNGRYELIAGERRLRAAKMAGLSRVPAIVRRPSDVEARVESLMENLQREELNQMDRARGLLALKEATGASWRGLAEILGLTERRVMQLVQLTKLEEGVQAMIARGALPGRVGITLAGLDGVEQLEMAERASTEGWSSDALAEKIKRAKGKTGETALAERKAEEVRRREVYASVLYRVMDPLLQFLETSLQFAREITGAERKEVMGRLERLERALMRFKAEVMSSG